MSKEFLGELLKLSGSISAGTQAFTEPWQARVFALALVLVRKRGWSWEEFRRRLIAAIDAGRWRPDADRSVSYYESWVSALEKLLVEKNLLSADEIARKAGETASTQSGSQASTR